MAAQVGIGCMRYLLWPGRLRVTGTMIGGVLLVLSGALSGFGFNAFLNRMAQWPYDPPVRRLVGENTTSDKGLVEVPAGGDLVMQRLTHYDPSELNCERWYARRAASKAEGGQLRGFQQRFEMQHDLKLPGDLSGLWQTWKATLDPEFPCGDAYLAEDVTAQCNWWHENVQKLTKSTIYTSFRVVGCQP